MTYTIQISVPAGPWPGGANMGPWDGETYADAEEALEVARSAYASRDRRRDVIVLDGDGRTFDWFKAEPAPTHPLVGDSRPVHFTRAEVQRMLARLTGPTTVTEEDVAEVHDLLAERLADTDRMLAEWDGTTAEETGR